MKTEELIKKKYGKLAVTEKAGELLFRWPDALKVIDEIDNQGKIISGMNFWAQRDNSIIEVNSTDYSDINEGPEAHKKTIEAARTLIKDELPDTADYVSFIVSGS